jgi:hypothetical protein
MLYFLTQVSGVMCPVPSGHALCVTRVLWGMTTTMCLPCQPLLRLGHTMQLVYARVQDSAWFSMAVQPSYGCAVHV